jgi:hypothetical protein
MNRFSGRDMKISIICEARAELISRRLQYDHVVRRYTKLCEKSDARSSWHETLRDGILHGTELANMTTYGYVEPYLLRIKEAWSHSQMSWDNFKVLAKDIKHLMWISRKLEIWSHMFRGNRNLHMRDDNIDQFIAIFLYRNWHQYYIPRNVDDVWEQLEDMYRRFTDFDYDQYWDRYWGPEHLVGEHPSKNTISRLEWEQNADVDGTIQWEADNPHLLNDSRPPH